MRHTSGARSRMTDSGMVRSTDTKSAYSSAGFSRYLSPSSKSPRHHFDSDLSSSRMTSRRKRPLLTDSFSMSLASSSLNSLRPSGDFALMP